MERSQSIETGQSKKGYHRLDLLMRCPRAFGFREILHLVPFTYSRAPALGTAIHQGLAAHYSNRSYLEGLESAPPQWAYAVPDAKRCLQSYVENYAFEPFEVLGVEVELEVLIHGDQPFTRRVDLVARSKLDRKLYILDHKTAGRVSARMKTVEHDGTLFSQTLVGAATIPQRFGGTFGGVILNLIETGGKTWRFRRETLVFPAQILRDAPNAIRYWSAQADAWIASGLSPWQFPQTFHCSENYGCDYYDLCRYGPSAVGQYDREVTK